MSTEDEQLSSLYKQAPQDVPPVHIDEAILAAARRETASRPHPAYSPFSNNWRVPASLAAVLVLSVGLVNLMENEPLLPDGIEPFAMEEAEMPRMEMADSIAITEDEQSLARAPAKPAIQSLAQKEERDAGRLALREPVAPLPTIKNPPVSTAADATSTGMSQGLIAEQLDERKLNEKVARKRKQQSFAESTDKIAAASTQVTGAARLKSGRAPAPAVEAITALRLAGKLEQANIAADAFIHHHFGDDLEKVEPMQVKLSLQDWKKFIVELKLLDRKQQADKLEGLLARQQDKLSQ